MRIFFFFENGSFMYVMDEYTLNFSNVFINSYLKIQLYFKKIVNILKYV